jgi:diadenosine tetraphosphate (Ap4A) HIT family hydrolase
MYHYRKTRQRYARHNQGDKKLETCTFCNEVAKGTNIIEEGKTMFVIPNRVSYDVFEGRKVTGHLMIIPKRHVEGFKDFTDEEALEFIRMSAKYETDGYNVYARGMGNVSRSVLHQHTHLIKTNSRLTKAFFYIRRPHFLIKI